MDLPQGIGGPDCQQGFSLLEVLVAFAILSLILGVLLQVFSTGLRNAAVAEEYTYAVLHAESLLAAVGTETLLQQGVEEGDIDEKYAWRLTITPYEMDEETGLLDDEAELLGGIPVLPLQVEVEVLWQSGDKRRSVLLQSLRLTAAE